MANDEAVVKLRAENAKLKADLNKAKGQVNKFGSSATAAFKKIGAAAAAAFATAKIISFVKTGILEFAKFDRSLTQITNKIERAGQSFDGMAEQVENYIRGAEEASRFNKFELAASLDDLLLKTGDYNTALQLNEKAMDLAVAGNISLKVASQALSLAYEGNTSGVSQIARVMGMATEDAKDLNKVFAELEKSTKGVARAEVGMAVELDKLNNSLNDGSELIGKEIGPMMVRFARFLVTGFTNAINFMIKLFKTWWSTMRMITLFIEFVFGPILDWLVKKAKQTARAIIPIWGAIALQVKKFTKTISDAADKSNNKIVQIFKDGATELKEIWETSAADKAEIDLAALDASFELKDQEQDRKDEDAKKDKSRKDKAADEDTIRTKSWETATVAAGNAISSSLMAFFRRTEEGAEGVGEAFKDMAKGMFKAIVSAIGESLIVQGIAKVAEGIAALLGIVTAGLAPGLFAAGAKLAASGAAIKGLSLALAEGGIVTRPTMALVGEAGPEAVIPLDRAGIGGFGGGPLTINANMSFPGIRNINDLQGGRFSQSAARQLAQGVQDMRQRKGQKV